MKIYFAGSIRGGRDEVESYAKIIRELAAYGTVLTEHVADNDLTEQGESKPSEYIYERDMAWLRTADVIVAEVTAPSLGVGYEIGIAETLGKKILCLFREGAGKNLSAMIAGNINIETVQYEHPEEVSDILKKFFITLAQKR